MSEDHSVARVIISYQFHCSDDVQQALTSLFLCYLHALLGGVQSVVPMSSFTRISYLRGSPQSLNCLFLPSLNYCNAYEESDSKILQFYARDAFKYGTRLLSSSL